MITLIQNIFLSQWFIVFVLTAIFFFFTGWAMQKRGDWRGYALGWLVAVFVILVYTALGGVNQEPQTITRALNLLEVIFPTICGLSMGGGIILLAALLRGSQRRENSLLIAFLTALNIVLIFLVLVEGRITQLMIGIFALAFGIAALLLAILAPSSSDNNNGGNTQQSNRNPVRSSSNRVDEIRNRMRDNDNR